MLLSRVHVLVCSSCEERIVLPHGSVPGMSEDQWYWPTDELLLKLACPLCGHLSAHSRQDVCLKGVQIEDPNLPPSVFWRVEFACAHESCGLPIVVHARTEGNALPSQPERLVLSAKPGPSCANGHPLGSAATAIHVEVIDWNWKK